MYEITGLQQKWRNYFQDTLYKDYFKKVMISTWGEEKYVTVLQKKLRVNREACALYIV